MHHQLAEKNALVIWNVIRIKAATITAVLILVWEFVGKGQSVKLGTINQCVNALKVLKVILMKAAINLQVSLMSTYLQSLKCDPHKSYDKSF